MTGKAWRLIVLAVLLAAPATLAFTYAREFLAVDSALDAGASHDYRAGRADFTRSHPYIPFSKRHATLLTVAGGAFVGAMGWTVAVVIRRRRDG